MERMTITKPGRQPTSIRAIRIRPEKRATLESAAPDAKSTPASSPPTLADGMVLAAVAAGLALTLIQALAPELRFAYHNRLIQAQIDAVAAMAALLVSLLALGHFRRTLLRADLMLATALGMLGTADLILALGVGFNPQGPTELEVWIPDAIRMLAAGLLAAAAWTRVARVRHPDEAIRNMFLTSVATMALVAGLIALLEGQLPAPINTGPSPVHQPLVNAPAGVLVVQATLVLAYGLAAVGFAARNRPRDLYSGAIAAAVALLAFAWLDFLLFSPIYSPWIESGDVLWFGASLVLLAGAANAIRLDQRDVARLALLHERGRVARELHDGLAQELVYLLGQARRMRSAQPGPEADQLVTAVERSLDETRAVISSFRAPVDESLDAALTRMTGELERRLGMEVELGLAREVHVAVEVREAILRIVGEALSNAARHGNAKKATVEMRENEQLHVLVRDSGEGFDPDRTHRRGGSFGLLVMRERAEAIGAKLEVRSAPGTGTEVQVIVP